MISQMSPEAQRKLAAGLVSLLAVVLAWRGAGPAVLDWFGGEAEDKAREARQSALAVDIVDLDLSALERDAGMYTPDRNLFRYPPPKREPPRTSAAKSEPRDLPPKPQPTETVAPRPVPPSLPYELLGIFGPERRRIAALKEGDDIVNALEEETLDEKFIVHEIRLNTVEFHFVGFTDESKVLKVEPERR